jgi:hypothetical protein
MRSRGVFCRASFQNFKGGLTVIDDDDGLAKNGNGANGTLDRGHLSEPAHIVRLHQVANIPYRSLCFSQCCHSCVPGAGKSNKFPMIGFPLGPGGRRATFFWFRNILPAIYSASTPITIVKSKVKAMMFSQRETTPQCKQAKADRSNWKFDVTDDFRSSDRKVKRKREISSCLCSPWSIHYWLISTV